MKSPSAYRQHNMKGKKFALMSCRCCYMFNFKDRLRKIEDKKEMCKAFRCIEE